MFQLTRQEAENLMSQIATSSSRSQFATLNEDSENLKSQNVISNWGGTRKLPFVFTENGVAMLSSVLRSKTAIEVNIRIMRAFTAMRSFLMSNAHMFQRLETLEHHQLLLQKHQSDTDKKIEEVLTRLDNNIRKSNFVTVPTFMTGFSLLMILFILSEALSRTLEKE